MTTAPLVDDPYQWLEDGSGPDTVRWLARQRQVADAHLTPLARRDWFRAALRDATEDGVERRHGRWRLRVAADDSTPAGLIAADRESDTWHTVFDPARSHPGGLAVISTWDASPNGEHVAVQVVIGGAERATPLHIVATATGEPVVQPLGFVRHCVVSWIDDGSFVYTRPNGVWRYDLRRLAHEVVFPTSDPMARVRPYVWHGRWVIVSQRRGTADNNTVWLIDLNGGPPWSARPIQAEPDAVTSALVRRDGRLLLVTTWGADRGQVVATGVDADRSTWRVVVPASPDRTVRAAAIVGDPPTEQLVVVFSCDNGTEVAAHDPDTGSPTGTVVLPGGTVSALGPDESDPAALCGFTYTDWVTPATRYGLHRTPPGLRPIGASRQRHPGVRTEHLRYPSAGGVTVPITVLTPMRGNDPRPMLLTAYGGFGVAVRPTYQPDALTWVRAGGALAIAHIRGGGGRGRQWHRAGSLDRKQSSFDDLHAAADWLVATGRTRHDRLVLLGTSNGGLLVTGAIVQSPERYAAGAAVAPLTDMVRYELFGLGSAWVSEYGTATDPEQLRWLLGYSPYHNVRPGRRYPPLLLLTGANDTRVDPLHARKLCARLQHADPDGGPTLLYVVDNAGHGANARPQQLDLAATALGFLATHAGL